MKHFAEIQIKIKYELDTRKGYMNDLGVLAHDANEMLEIDLNQINNLYGISEFLDLMSDYEISIISANVIKE